MDKSMWMSLLGTVLLLAGSITLGLMIDKFSWPIALAIFSLSAGGWLKGMELERVSRND
jgi:uncharacterized membrane protein